MDELLHSEQSAAMRQRHDPSQRAAWMQQMHQAMAKAREQYRAQRQLSLPPVVGSMPVARKPARVCEHLGQQTGEEASCLCGSRGVMIPIYVCNLHQIECTVDPHKHGSQYRVCKRCDDGPWAMK